VSVSVEPLCCSPVVIAATELGDQQLRIRPHGVMPGRLFCAQTFGKVHLSISQVKLKSEPLCNFLNASLISNQIAGRRQHYRLPSISVIFANADLYLTDVQCRNDHVG
jgi:hypothetical protein